MPFKADTFRVLIASPSGLAQERQAAAQWVNVRNAQGETTCNTTAGQPFPGASDADRDPPFENKVTNHCARFKPEGESLRYQRRPSAIHPDLDVVPQAHSGSSASPNDLVDAGPFFDDNCSRATFYVPWSKAFVKWFTNCDKGCGDPIAIVGREGTSLGRIPLGNALPVALDRHGASPLTTTILQPKARTNGFGSS
jgi:hypothetical protein